MNFFGDAPWEVAGRESHEDLLYFLLAYKLESYLYVYVKVVLGIFICV